MAHFDKAIPPGGEGKISLKLNLKGYQGTVKKTATVFSNDPARSRTVLTMQGTVKALIEVRPTSSVSFRGLSDQIQESTIDIIAATPQQFHISKTESTLDQRVKYELETVEEGKHYRLKISNLLKQGNYNGVIKLYTDLPQKSEIPIRVTGYIEGEVSVKPQTVLIGKLTAQQPVRVGKVVVMSNRGKPFQISKLTYDERLLQVTQQPIPNEQQGYSLDITPKLDSLPPGKREQTVLTIETDVSPSDKYEVQVHVMNMTAVSQPANTANPEDDEDEEEDTPKSSAPGTEKEPNPPGPMR